MDRVYLVMEGQGGYMEVFDKAFKYVTEAQEYIDSKERSDLYRIEAAWIIDKSSSKGPDNSSL